MWGYALGYSAEIPVVVAEQIRLAKVTCVVTANDIPDKVSPIGFDDIALARLVSPTLTTVHLPIRRLGERAFEMLCDQIGDPTLPVRWEQLEVKITRRESLTQR